MLPEYRFQGILSEDYQLVRQAIPNFHELQNRVADAVADCTPHDPAAPVHVLDLGCGDGATSRTILTRCPHVRLTALDSEASMIGQARANLADAIGAGRCQVIHHDALDYLRGLPEHTFDAVASALMLHNLDGDYRHALHEAIYRVLTPGGRFINADKYAANEEQRHRRLQRILERFFDLFVPLGKLDLLRASVLHEVGDEAPDRVMSEELTVRELTALGFGNVIVRNELPMAAVLLATRPS